MILFDQRTRDGSRHFACLHQNASWAAVRDHVGLLPNAEIVHSMADGRTALRLDFRYRGHQFLLIASSGLVHLFVRDPQCAEMIVYEVGCHFERLLGSCQHEPGAMEQTPNGEPILED